MKKTLSATAEWDADWKPYAVNGTEDTCFRDVGEISEFPLRDSEKDLSMPPEPFSTAKCLQRCQDKGMKYAYVGATRCHPEYMGLSCPNESSLLAEAPR